MTLLSENESRGDTADDGRESPGSRSGPPLVAAPDGTLPVDSEVDRQLETVWRWSVVEAKLDRLTEAMDMFRAEAPRLGRWAEHLAGVLVGGGRLLVAGNGGSAAEAQHLSAELVGKLRDDRPAYSAIALHAETSSVTAIGNDYGFEQVFARQVQAHGRPGDVLMLMSTSGRSRNLVAAAEAAREREVTSWAMTGRMPNPLGMCCDDVLAVAADPQTIQELHLVAVHALCEQMEAALPAGAGRADRYRGNGVRR
jgi:D-sedoheptulose 7-phosphate isomerase